MTVTGFVDGEAVVSGETEDPSPIGHASLGLDFSGTAADDADITEVDPFTVSYTDFAFYDLAGDPDAPPAGPVLTGTDPDPTPTGYGAVVVPSVLGAAGATTPPAAPAYAVSFEDFRLIALTEG